MSFYNDVANCCGINWYEGDHTLRLTALSVETLVRNTLRTFKRIVPSYAEDGYILGILPCPEWGGELEVAFPLTNDHVEACLLNIRIVEERHAQACAAREGRDIPLDADRILKFTPLPACTTLELSGEWTRPEAEPVLRELLDGVSLFATHYESKPGETNVWVKEKV